MASTWKPVRVFVSSTFRDMHSERDHLVNVGSFDGTVRVWDLVSGRQQALYVADAGVRAVAAINSDGRLICGTTDGQVHFLRIENLPKA